MSGMGIIGKLFAPLAWLLKRLRGPYRSVLDTAKPKLKAEALAWVATHYPNEGLQKIAARFVLILEGVNCVPIKQFTPRTRFLEDLGMDELEPVEVIMWVEQEFQIPEIPEDDAVKLRTIDDTIRYLAAREDCGLKSSKIPPSEMQSA